MVIFEVAPTHDFKTSLFSDVHDTPVEWSNVVINADVIIIYGSFDVTGRYIWYISRMSHQKVYHLQFVK